MSEMIERVAMAIDPFAWSQEHGMQVRRENSLMQAHDAIEAMRVPDTTMRSGLGDAVSDSRYAVLRHVIPDEELVRVFTAMIDAALATTPKES